MQGRSGTRGTFSRAACVLAILACCFGTFPWITAVHAEEYDPQEAGHPLKILAYLAFPIGTLIDYGLMRPAYWVVQKEPFRTIFGYEYLAYSEDPDPTAAPADPVQRQK